MVKTRHEINGIIKRYKESLATLGINPEKVILYGSYAHDRAGEGSDIDLIVVSSDFGDKNIRERLELLGIASVRIMEPIQAQGYTPDELNSKDRSSFIQEILGKNRDRNLFNSAPLTPDTSLLAPGPFPTPRPLVNK